MFVFWQVEGCKRNFNKHLIVQKLSRLLSYYPGVVELFSALSLVFSIIFQAR